MNRQSNPFTVKTPEDIPAPEVLELFVDVFEDFQKILGDGHVFLNGPRGCGKSMIFRYLQPDCQLLANNCTHIRDLKFIGIYASIKNCDLKITELARLERQHASVVLNEHFMVTFILNKTFDVLTKLTKDLTDQDDLDCAKKMVYEKIYKLLQRGGFQDSIPELPSAHSVSDYFGVVLEVASNIHAEMLRYLRHLSFQQTAEPFRGPLLGYLDFLLPLFGEVMSLSFMPSDKPIYLLLDDADNLNETQTQILNTWISTRTSKKVSLKIATQMRYKTFCTVTSDTIDTPHDYAEVNMSTIYTSRKRLYMDRVTAIVHKRLRFAGIIDRTPTEFFPQNIDQEQKIQSIAEQLKAAWAVTKKGFRAGDDAYRYARPDYIRSLGGISKSTHTYSYSGFEQLVHVSSGIVRYFLEAASEMFAVEQAASGDANVQYIGTGVQDQILRKQAEEFLFGHLDRLISDDKIIDRTTISKLGRLIKALGAIFREILLSDRTERRVFSVALVGEPSEELKKVLMLGKQYGYFHESSIGNKEGTGRTRLYVLSRRIAPFFNLDPTSFAGYLFIQSSLLEQAMLAPESFIRSMTERIKGLSDSDDVIEERQLKLFD